MSSSSTSRPRSTAFPKNRFVADFIGTCNILDAEVLSIGEETMRVKIPGLGEVNALHTETARIGQRGALALRPEQVAISPQLVADSASNHFAGKVFDFLYLGDVTVYVVELPNGSRVEAMLPNSAPGRAKFFEAGDAGGHQLAVRRRPLPGGLTCANASSTSG